jgi:Cof subfamily protein (haloacid dehalogenase superfamily)
MAIRLIVTDMDGTLLDAAHQLPQGFAEVVAQLRERGIHWGIASGRQLANLKQRFDEVGVAVDLIAENGALAQLAHDDVPFFCDLSPVTAFDQVLRTALAISGATPVLCGATCAWVHQAYPEHFTEIARYFCETQTWATFEDVAMLSICKVAIYHPQAATALYPKLQPCASEDVRVILSGPNWVDVQLARIDKAHALKALMKTLGVTPEQTLVFGDYFNDVGMLTCGVQGVAMGNALPEIKALTPYHALPNTQNGVMDYLHRIGVLT